MLITEATLHDWAALFDPEGTTASEARLLRPLTVEHIEGISQIASIQERLADAGYSWTSLWHEKGAKEDGTIRWHTGRVDDWREVILQGPNFAIATPLRKEPNVPCKSNKDYSEIDLVRLSDRLIPRTNYERACDRNTYDARIPRWGGRPCTERWRLAWRNMAPIGSARTLTSAIIPPGPSHVHTVYSLACESNRETALVCGLWAAIPADYLVKINATNIGSSVTDRFPAPLAHRAAPLLLLRTLRLNCLIRDYAPLWEELYEAGFAADSWTSSFAEWPKLGVQQREWSMDTPLRTDFERRAALVEIDALAAIMLGLTADQLVLMYTGQFGVLRKYEYTMWFDNRGDKIAKEHHAMGVRQQKDDYKLLMAYNDGEPCGDLLDRYEAPFIQPDREAEMRAAYAEFTERLGL